MVKKIICRSAIFLNSVSFSCSKWTQTELRVYIILETLNYYKVLSQLYKNNFIQISELLLAYEHMEMTRITLSEKEDIP